MENMPPIDAAEKKKKKNMVKNNKQILILDYSRL